MGVWRTFSAGGMEHEKPGQPTSDPATWSASPVRYHLWPEPPLHSLPFTGKPNKQSSILRNLKINTLGERCSPCVSMPWQSHQTGTSLSLPRGRLWLWLCPAQRLGHPYVAPGGPPTAHAKLLFTHGHTSDLLSLQLERLNLGPSVALSHPGAPAFTRMAWLLF